MHFWRDAAIISYDCCTLISSHNSSYSIPEPELSDVLRPLYSSLAYRFPITPSVADISNAISFLILCHFELSSPRFIL